MAYFLVENFSSGVDVRKSVVTSDPGTLRKCENAFVNAGGEIEKRKAFKKLGVFAEGSHGLAVKDGVLQHFAKGSTVGFVPEPGVPLSPDCIALTPDPSTGEEIERVLYAETFGDKVFSCVLFGGTDGVRYFLDGDEVDTGFSGALRARMVQTHRSKLYGAAGRILRFSAVEDAANWTSGTGAGFLDVALAETGTPSLVSIASYYTRLALLGERSIQIWSMDPDPAQNQIIETLGNIGAIGHRSAATYGTGDVLFLSGTGIRSIRARDSSNAAILNDIGSPIDSLIQARNPTGLSRDEADRIIAMVDPASGQFWLIWGTTIYVLSFYPSARVSAWSTFVAPDEVTDAVVLGQSLYIRCGRDLYEYDCSDCTEDIAEAVTPMISCGTPATFKNFMSLDVAAEGHWQVDVAPDPLAPDVWTPVATIENSTYSLRRIAFQAYTTHVAFRFRSIGGEPAKIGAAALHFEPGEAE